jgi:transcriptional regulator GlxA family with amidase domain
VDKKYYTSSGISAGIDMSFGFISDRLGEERAKEIAKRMEYGITMYSLDKGEKIGYSRTKRDCV